MLGEAGCRLRMKVRSELSEKLHWLRTQRFGSEELNTKSVFNLSNLELSRAQLEVLCRGPKFGIPPRRVCKEEILSEFELYFNQIKPLFKESAVDKEKKDILKAKLASLAHEYAGTKQDRRKFPLGKEHFEAIHELRSNEDIVITRPDKGVGIVLMDKSDYVAKMMDILNDSSKFECLGSCDECDNTGQNERALQAFLYRLSKDGKIDEEVYARIRPTGSVRPRMYGLPKLHKPEPVPLRPILSMVGSAQHELARWLSEVLAPVLKRYSSRVVKDSFSFCEILHQYDGPVDGSYMCSFDVKSLFTNVPIDETIKICLDTLYRSEEVDPPGIDEPILKKLLLKCTRDVEFSFNDRMYRQIDGVAMGSPLGPILANIFLGYCESLFPKERWPDLYRRYVDDTFSLFTGGEQEALEFLDLLNSLHPSIQFTMEGEIDGKLPFLDALVMRMEGRFSTTIYRKPTATGVYTRWESYCSSSQKIALIQSLVGRAKRICSPEHLEQEITSLKTILLGNGYPLPIIERVVDRALHPDPPVYGPKLKPLFIRLPWLGAPSLALKKRLQNATTSAIHWCRTICSFSSTTAFNTCRKDVLPTESISNVIYLFKCECDHTYVGRTILRLEERVKKHVPKDLIESVVNVSDKKTNGVPAKRKRGRPRKENPGGPLHPSKEDTAITKHLKASSSCLNEVAKMLPRQFSILARGRTALHLQYLEAIFISTHQPKLCVQKDHVVSLALF